LQSPVITGNDARGSRGGGADAVDAFTYDGDRWAIGVLADGVSACASGGAAARDAIAKAKSQLRSRLDRCECGDHPCEGVVECTHTFLAERYAGNGLCTLVVALLERRAGRVWTAHVGDSAVFRVGDGTPFVARVTDEDDQATHVRKQAGSTVIRDGMPMIDTGLAQAVGSTDSIVVHYHKAVLEPRDWAIAIMSDGIRAESLGRWVASNPWQRSAETLEYFVSGQAREWDDDASAAVLYRSPPERLDELMEWVLPQYGAYENAQRLNILEELAGHKFLPKETLASIVHSEPEAELAVKAFQLLTSGNQLTQDEAVSIVDQAYTDRRVELAQTVLGWLRRRAL